MVAKAMVDSDMLWGWLDSYYEIADAVDGGQGSRKARHPRGSVRTSSVVGPRCGQRA